MWVWEWLNSYSKLPFCAERAFLICVAPFEQPRILRYLERRGVITLDSDADSDVLCVSEELAERDPALAQLAAAAVSGLAPAGPELRRKPRELAFAGRPGVVIDAPLSVREAGFSLHAATRAGPADEQGREALLKYILRPPLANERLLPGPDGLVRIALKKPFSVSAARTPFFRA